MSAASPVGSVLSLQVHQRRVGRAIELDLLPDQRSNIAAAQPALKEQGGNRGIYRAALFCGLTRLDAPPEPTGPCRRGQYRGIVLRRECLRLAARRIGSFKRL